MERWHPAPVLTLIFIAAASPPAWAEPDGKALYEANCAKCHGPDGKGDTPAGKMMKVPVWHGIEAGAVADHVRKDARHKTLSDKLSDADLQAIAGYVAKLSAS